MTDEHMPQTMDEIMNPGIATQRDPAFPDAPIGWNQQQATEYAAGEGFELTGDHWEVVRALQHYYKRHENQSINKRELHDALDEKFHAKGGLKYLYGILPSGPLAVGCRLAGLEPPAGSTDAGIGSAG